MDSPTAHDTGHATSIKAGPWHGSNPTLFVQLVRARSSHSAAHAAHAAHVAHCRARPPHPRYTAVALTQVHVIVRGAPLRGVALDARPRLALRARPSTCRVGARTFTCTRMLRLVRTHADVQHSSVAAHAPPAPR